MFLLAVVGGAVGLGNIWRFPYVVGENGGGVFLLLYIFFVVAASLPLKMAEVAIGKGTQGSPVLSLRSAALEEGATPRWDIAGWLMMSSSLLVLTFYPVIGGWSLRYVFVALGGSLHGLDAASALALFESVNENPWSIGAWHLAFLVITVAFVARGIRGGLETVFKLAVPGLLVILILLVGRALMVGDVGSTMRFLFDFDFSRVSVDMALMAMGQAFFSLGVGSGIFLTYGSYAPPGVSVARTMVSVGIADTTVSILAGLAVFPFVFGFGLEPAAGPNLFFLTLPIAFGGMPFGSLVGALFFLLLFLAAISSSVGMLECSISRLKELYPAKTVQLAVLVGTAAWLLGILSVLSYNVWEDLEPLAWLGVFSGKNFFQIFDYTLSNFLLPLNGALVALFVGWVVSVSRSKQHVGIHSPGLFRFWLFQLRYVIPSLLILLIVIGIWRG